MPLNLPTASTRVSKLGIQPAVGSFVQATKLLLSLGIDLSLQQTVDVFTPPGFKYATFADMTQDWSAAAITGRATFDELMWFMASVLTTPTSTNVGTTRTSSGGSNGATPSVVTDTAAAATDVGAAVTFQAGTGTVPAGTVVTSVNVGVSFTVNNVIPATVTHVTVAGVASTWTFDPSSTQLDIPILFSVEQGNNVITNRAVDMILSDLELAVDRGGQAAITGTGVGGLFSAAVSNITSATNSVLARQALPGMFNIYVDTSASALGTTKLLDCQIADFRIGSRFAPFWALRTDKGSWTDLVEQMPAVDMTLTMAADATGWGYLTNSRAGQTLFVRVEAIGPNIPGTAVPYNLRCDFAGKVNAVPAMGDSNNALTLAWGLAAAHDPTWGKAMEVKLTNQLPMGTNGTSALTADPTLV